MNVLQAEEVDYHIEGIVSEMHLRGIHQDDCYFIGQVVFSHDPFRFLNVCLRNIDCHDF